MLRCPSRKPIAGQRNKQLKAWHLGIRLEDERDLLTHLTPSESPIKRIAKILHLLLLHWLFLVTIIV